MWYGGCACSTCLEILFVTVWRIGCSLYSWKGQVSAIFGNCMSSCRVISGCLNLLNWESRDIFVIVSFSIRGTSLVGRSNLGMPLSEVTTFSTLVILMCRFFFFTLTVKGNGSESCILEKVENIPDEASKLLRSLRILTMSKTISSFLTFYGGKRWTTGLC